MLWVRENSCGWKQYFSLSFQQDDLVKRHDDELGAMAELEDCVINAIVEAEQKHGHLAESKFVWIYLECFERAKSIHCFFPFLLFNLVRSKLNADHASALKRLRCDVALANQVRINIQRNAEINKSRIDTLNQLDAKIKAKRAKLVSFLQNLCISNSS